MKKVLFLIKFLLVLLVANAQQAPDICLNFFTGDYCRECKKLEKEIQKLEAHYPTLAVNRYDINQDLSNVIRLTDLYNDWKVPPESQHIPAVFLGKRYFTGTIKASAIEFEIRMLLKEANAPCPEPLTETTTKVGRQKKLDTLPLLTIIGAALVDSINPCAIAVLLILLTALLAANEKKRAIKAGLAFSTAIFIFYFLFGLGLFSAIQVIGLSYWFYKVVGFLAILIGLGNIKDYFWYGGGGFVMEIPRKWRPKMKQLLRSVTSPMGAFSMGFVVCLFELPCTGGPYLFILGLLAEKSTRMQAIPLLLLYNFFFILPLLIISGLVYFGFTTVEDTNKWKNRNYKIMHLVIGVMMLILGILVVFELI